MWLFVFLHREILKTHNVYSEEARFSDIAYSINWGGGNTRHCYHHMITILGDSEETFEGRNAYSRDDAYWSTAYIIDMAYWRGKESQEFLLCQFVLTR